MPLRCSSDAASQSVDNPKNLWIVCERKFPDLLISPLIPILLRNPKSRFANFLIISRLLKNSRKKFQGQNLQIARFLIDLKDL